MFRPPIAVAATAVSRFKGRPLGGHFLLLQSHQRGGNLAFLAAVHLSFTETATDHADELSCLWLLTPNKAAYSTKKCMPW